MVAGVPFLTPSRPFAGVPALSAAEWAKLERNHSNPASPFFAELVLTGSELG